MTTEWLETTLGESFEMYQPKTLSKNELDMSGRYKVYGANGVIGTHTDYNHELPQVLITCRGATCGNINVSEKKSWINGNAMVLKPKKNNINLNYLKHYLKSGIDFSRIITGAAQPQITRESLKKVKIKIPPIKTQKHISNILELTENLAYLREQSIKKTSELAHSIFEKIFGDIKSNNKNWPIKKLGDLVKKIGSGATPRGGAEAYKSKGISLIRSLNVHDDFFNFKNLVFIDDEQAHKLSNVEVKRNDLLLNITGASVARTCIVPESILPARVNQHVMIIRPKDSLDSIFLGYLFLNPKVKSKLLSIAGSGATREAITKKAMESFEIIVPPMKLQNEFRNNVLDLQDLKKNMKTYQNKISNLSLSLKYKLFRLN